MNGYVVDVNDVSFSYPDGTPALRGLTLAVAAGEKVALIGPNGAGKSTLLLHLNGIYRGDGAIRVAGMEVSADTVRRVRAKVGLVFQHPDDQLFSPTVFEDVAFGPLHMGLAEEDVRLRVDRALGQVGMGSYSSRMPHHLSLGEKKRVAIATVLSMDPEILALDEPSAGLDPQARRTLIELLQVLPQAMLIASHDIDFVKQVCSRAVLMVRGRVDAQFVGDELMAIPAEALW